MIVPHPQIEAIFNTYHDQLSVQLRYDRFRQEETIPQYVNLLGPDVLGLTHPRVTGEITERFLTHNEAHSLHLTTHEQLLLRTTPYIHDLGELIIETLGVGDVSFDQKTATHEQEEHRVFLKVLETIPPGPEKDLIREAYTDVAMDRSTKLGRMFNAIERIGYLETAIRAFEGVKGKRIANWHGLIGNVLSNQIETLLRYQREYPYVWRFINTHVVHISDMFHAVSAKPVPPDHEGNPSYAMKKFNDAKKMWEEYSMAFIQA